MLENKYTTFKNKLEYVINEAIEEAEQVLSDNYILQPPIPILDLVKNYGYQIKCFNSDDNKSGLISIKSKVIAYNAKESNARIRFTLAHELGHAIMHPEHEDEIFYRKPLGEENDPREQEANCFAANLLVPERMLRRYYLVESRLEKLASIFNVSKDVIGFRLDSLKLEI